MAENERIRLCMVLHSLMGGGAERFMINLLRNISRHKKFDVSLILLNSKGDYLDLLPSDIYLIELNMKLPSAQELTHPRWIFKLAKALKNQNPQIIFSTLGYTNLMMLLAKILIGGQSRTIIRETRIATDQLKVDPWGAFKKCIYKLIYPRADLIIGPSQAVIESLSSFISFKSDQVKVIPNFVDPNFLNEKKIDKRDIAALKLPTDRPVIISVGHLEKIKGLDISLRAFHKLQQHVPSYYWILGRGQEETVLKQLVQDLGITDRVFFLGFQKNPYCFMQQAKVFILASRSEGFPNSLLEAFFCKIPSIITKCNSSMESIVQSPSCGFLVEVDDVYAITDAMRIILTQPDTAQNIIKNAYNRVTNYFPAQVVHIYEEIFQGSVKNENRNY